MVGGKGSDVSKATLRNVLYPLWDAGFQVGHAVVTPKEAIERGEKDLHAATSLLSARRVAGATDLFEELLDRRTRWIKRQQRSLVRRIVEGMEERHRTAERAGWTLAPDLKNDIGGLRDVNTVQWLDALTDSAGLPEDLASAADVLLSVREGLHSRSTRKLDNVRIDLQPEIARWMGLVGEDGPDILMEAVHTSARTIEHRSRILIGLLQEGALGGPRRSGSTKELSPGVRLEDSLVRVTGLDPTPEHGMTLLAAVATTGKQPSSAAMDWLDACFHTATLVAWPRAMLADFVAILGAPNATDALELLDHSGGWPVVLPEWNNVRGRAQHDPYHRYTVDGHSFFAVALAREVLQNDPSARRAAEPLADLTCLYLSVLFHDIGKGSGEDHSVAGERLARSATTRMGLTDTDVDRVARLVRHHLLLSDTATRRDIDDGAVVSVVADTIRDADTLRCLYVLSIADGLATGQGSWTSWKASLVGRLFRRVLVALESGELPERSDVGSRLAELRAYDPLIAPSAESVLATMPPSYLTNATIEDIADDVRLLQHPPGPGQIATRIDPGLEAGQYVVTVCSPDRPGALARTSGVLALHRISVLTAQAYTSSNAIALERFVVSPPEAIDPGLLESDLAAAYSGRLALEARLEQKALDYRPKEPVTVDVRILQEESEHSTVLEVRSRDVLGLLYALTSAISELDLDIHVAKIDTLGERVVDVFYVRSLQGTKIDDVQAAEVRKAIEHRVNRLFG